MRSDVWAFVVRNSGQGPTDSPRKPRRNVFGGIFADTDAIAAVKFGDAPSY